MKNTNIVDYMMILTGSIYSLANIEHILGIIILVIQLAWIIIKLGYKVYTKIKKGGDIAELEGDVKDTIDNLEDIKNSINTEDKKNE